MRNSELQKYTRLNELSEPKGIVIFGGSEDISLPIGEIKQAFAIEEKIYNRSYEQLSVREALDVYKKSVVILKPDTIFLHLGSADKELFAENTAVFDQHYRELINYIRKQNEKCHIVIVSLQNHEKNSKIENLNEHLKYISDSERCTYGDIADKKVWNPKSTMDAVSFVYSIGFVRPLKNKRPIYDLLKMLFCYEA